MTIAYFGCADCTQFVAQHPELAKGRVWMSTGGPLRSEPPFHSVRFVSEKQAPESRGNFSGTLRDVTYEAACGLTFTVEIDSGD